MADNEEFMGFFLSLPADPEEAYVVFHARKSAELDEWQSKGVESWWGERKFYDAMTAFDEVYDLKAFSAYGEPPSSDRDFSDLFFSFRRAADKLSMKFQLEQARRTKSTDLSVLVFDNSARQAVRQLIEAIKQHIETVQIDEPKRRSLMAKLNVFAAEVDQNLTRTEAFFEFAVQASKTFKDVGAEFKPLGERIDRILDIIERTQKWVESLPPWSKRKELEAPPKRIEGPKENGSMDDDIPF